MSCLVQDGASYHESPISTSSFPSRFTSAIATPSERNFPSITVFFHETGVGSSPMAAEAVASNKADRARPVVQVRMSMILSPRVRPGETPRRAGIPPRGGPGETKLYHSGEVVGREPGLRSWRPVRIEVTEPRMTTPGGSCVGND